MITRSGFHLTIPVLITEQSDIDLAISIFNRWCAKRETIKQYGYIRIQPQKAEFFLTTNQPIKPYLIHSIVSRFEHASHLICLTPAIAKIE